MPELPDIEVYRGAIERRTLHRRVAGLRLNSVFVLRSVDPPAAALQGRAVEAVSRLGKRIVVRLDGGLFLVVHLMISGRLHWKPAGCPLKGKQALAALDFEHGSLVLTEAATRKRASLRIIAGEAALAAQDPGGVEPFEASHDEFRAALRRENHTLKRALTDPRLFSGIGNAYSDEILHSARLSPFLQTHHLTDVQIQRLHEAVLSVLLEWSGRLAAESGDGWPEKVTAFRAEMAVHGKYGMPCPACGEPVQRIVYAENESNYCAACQTGGKLLADRALSRLLGADWPRSLDELEEMKATHRTKS